MSVCFIGEKNYFFLKIRRGALTFKTCCIEMIDFVFKGGGKTFTSVNKFSAFWSNIPSGIISCSKLSLKEVAKHLIQNAVSPANNWDTSGH